MKAMRRLVNNRGTSTLEFVVVLPVLLFVLFSIVELSRAWLTLNLATAAAREGVRAGVVAAPDSVSTAGGGQNDSVLGPRTRTGGGTCAACARAAGQGVSAAGAAHCQTL